MMVGLAWCCCQWGCPPEGPSSSPPLRPLGAPMEHVAGLRAAGAHSLLCCLPLFFLDNLQACVALPPLALLHQPPLPPAPDEAHGLECH